VQNRKQLNHELRELHELFFNNLCNSRNSWIKPVFANAG
jgi:hypothetical protein